MAFNTVYYDFAPTITPMKNSGTLNYKIIIKKDFTRTDGTNALYLRLFQGGRRKRIPLGISVPLQSFDEQKQRIKKTFENAETYNLLIGKVLGDLNKLLVNYKLSNKHPVLEEVVQDLTKPTLRANFNAFALNQLELQRELKLAESTYKQQLGQLKKIQEFQEPILFSEVTEDLLLRLKKWCVTTKNNLPASVESTIKTFKKYLHLANKAGIETPLHYEDVKVKRMVGHRTFLTPAELKKVYDYYQLEFISATHKAVLQRYLFSCFTGLRISDIEQLTPDNLFGDHLGFTMEKTKKFIRIKLNQVALSLIGQDHFFAGDYSRKHINETLKEIASALGIKKRLYFHSSRHTFATNFLISGGDVINLQRLLGHSDIKQTMIYVHIVDDITDKQVDLLDNIIK